MQNNSITDVEVSIIMPCFNSEKYLENSINSVVKQSFKNWELLICNDGSTDNSESIITMWVANDSRIKLIPNTIQKGAAGARNSCLNYANGRYIAFLDSDDVWLEKKLEKQIAFMKEKNIVFSYTDYICIDENDITLSYIKAPRWVNFNRMLASNFVGCLTVIYDVDFFGKFNQPLIKKRNDYALWLVMFKKYPSIKGFSIQENLAKYRTNTYGLSSNKWDAVKYYWRCIRQYGNKSILYTFVLFQLYISLILIKKLFPKCYNLLIRLWD